MFDKIVLLPNREKDPDLSLSRKTLDVLRSFCPHVYTDEKNKELTLAGALPYGEGQFPKDASLLLVLGGDGTMLHAATTAAEYDIPMLGVNIGRLGYLTSVEPSKIEELKGLSEGTYTEQARMMLRVALQKESGEEQLLGYALNDVVIDGAGRLTDLRLYEAHSYLDYRADGLIVATPTGSTAYSLSAGGPVMDESMDAICVTPICPRSFFSRSLLFPEDARLRIENVSTRAHRVVVSLDGDTDAALAPGEVVTVCRAEKRVRLLTLQPRRLLEVLSTKMNTQHF